MKATYSWRVSRKERRAKPRVLRPPLGDLGAVAGPRLRGRAVTGPEVTARGRELPGGTLTI